MRMSLIRHLILADLSTIETWSSKRTASKTSKLICKTKNWENLRSHKRLSKKCHLNLKSKNEITARVRPEISLQGRTAASQMDAKSQLVPQWPQSRRNKSRVKNSCTLRPQVSRQISIFQLATANEGRPIQMRIITQSTWCTAAIPKYRCK
jgi:hypothetical protein